MLYIIILYGGWFYQPNNSLLKACQTGKIYYVTGITDKMTENRETPQAETVFHQGKSMIS